MINIVLFPKPSYIKINAETSFLSIIRALDTRQLCPDRNSSAKIISISEIQFKCHFECLEYSIQVQQNLSIWQQSNFKNKQIKKPQQLENEFSIRNIQWN